MKTKNFSVLEQNKDILMVFGITGLILLVPYMAMQFNWQLPDPGSTNSGGFDWNLFDFAVIGTLLVSAGLTYAFMARKIHNNTHKLLLGLLTVGVVLYIWAELAVGIFTNLGS